MNKPESYSPEDEAAIYVMGGLTADERLEFMARLAESADLRALVRELEEGAVALALASPVKQPPRKVWTRIEKAVGGEAKKEFLRPLFQGGGWWRQGWAAAAACLAGWLLYALWVNRPERTASPAALEASVHAEPGTTPAEIAPIKTSEAKSPALAGVGATPEMLQARARETAALRARVEELENRVTHLAQSVSQQAALLGETNRLKFVNLSPLSNTGETTAPVKLSPDLQRAIDLAMAHELGWTQTTGAVSSAEPGIAPGHSLPTNLAGVDFVDFRPSSNGVVNPPRIPNQAQAQSEQSAVPPPAPAPTPGGTIPAFISGDSLIMAIDSTIAAKGSQLTFVTGTPEQGQQTLGTTVLGDNPTIVAIPMNLGNSLGLFYGGSSLSPLQSPAYAGLMAGGWGVSVFAVNGYGYSNVFQYYLTGTNAP